MRRPQRNYLILHASILAPQLQQGHRMSERVENLAALSEALTKAGMGTSLLEGGETMALEGRFGVKAAVVVHWEKDSTLVRVEQLTKIPASRLGDRERRAKVLDRVRDEGLIGHAVEDDDGTIVFRTHLFACADGSLEVDTLFRVLRALGGEAVAALDRHLIPSRVRVTSPWVCYAE
jgi:hypothetical protein